MSESFTLEDLNHAREKLEARETERPLLATKKDFDEFNESIPKFPPNLNTDKPMTKRHRNHYRRQIALTPDQKRASAERHNLQYEFIKLAEEAGIDAEQAGQRTQTKVDILQKMISGEITGDILNG